MQSVSKLLHGSDIFGVPSNVGQQSSSILGGCCSLIIFAVVAISASLSLRNLIVTPQFTTQVNSFYEQRDLDSGQTIVIPTSNTTMAAAIGVKSDFLPSSEYFRIQFYTNQYGDSLVREFTWIPAVKCSELFADQLEAEASDQTYGSKFFTQQFGSDTNSEFICPDLSQIVIENDLLIDSNQPRQTFGMVVNSCKVAQVIDEQNGLVSYADKDGKEECVTHEESVEYAEYYPVRSKFMTATINPQNYYENQQVEYEIQTPIISPLSGSYAQRVAYTVNQNTIVYRGNQFISWFEQTFSSFDFSLAYQSSDFSETYNWEFGFYQTQISQGNYPITTSYTIESFLGLVTIVLSLFATLYGAMQFFISGYINFVAQMAKLDQLYGVAPPISDAATAEQNFATRLRETSRLKMSYAHFACIKMLESVCCCFKSCCRRNFKCYDRGSKNLQKYRVATQRLQDETDLVTVLKLLRVSRLLHEKQLAPRQRQTLDYARLFVLEDDSEYLAYSELSSVEHLLANFDPVGDPEDELLLRLVTGDAIQRDQVRSYFSTTPTNLQRSSMPNQKVQTSPQNTALINPSDDSDND